MKRIKWQAVLVMTVVFFLWISGCKNHDTNSLSVTGGKQVIYKCGTGEVIRAKYYSLSDNSLHFVKLIMPDGKKFTLPQAMSASGVRYTDGRELVWWTKGNTAFAEKRSENGDWKTIYNNCIENSGN